MAILLTFKSFTLSEFKMKNLFRNFKRGFTLIELLVVIAIISLLASIILVSIRTARNETRAGATRTTLSGIREEEKKQNSQGFIPASFVLK